MRLAIPRSTEDRSLTHRKYRGGGEPQVNSFSAPNALDGFVIDVDDWDEGEAFSLNWLFASLSLVSGGAPYHVFPVGYGEDPFGFGVMSLVRIEPSIGSDAGSLPGPIFVGNVGFDQSNFSFYDTVYEIPNPAEFAAEFGAGLTAPFINPADNIFNFPINTRLVPEPTFVVFVGSGLAGFAGVSSRRRRQD